ncbi:hypothetical protein N4P33_05165 [Streptomyces sp. 15-116A]|uniref:hypothetical protein n=1 Tax=Streptomyces sp. 15-116A TaxID=2259035 RepID=UPI0021B2C69C|nr:hypothetical protein [Streptomyces sp. 15-116A]MCT7351559.1 hypothetical protein [Streptomyces sp. 15-116A]
MPGIRSLPGVVAMALAATALSTAVARPASDTQVPCGEEPLKQAIREANDAGGGTLRLSPGCVYEISRPDSPTNALPAVISDIVIHGNESVIRRTSAANVRIFLVDSPEGALRLDHLTLRDGHSTDSGGGISVRPHSSLVARHVTLAGNTADERGGAIDNFGGSVSFYDSTFTGNTSMRGGGIFQDGHADFHDSQLSDNTATVSGAAVYGNTGRVTFDGVTITGNTARNGGGGIALAPPGVAFLRDTAITDNQVTVGNGGGVLTAGTLDVDRSRIENNAVAGTGGGIYNLTAPVTGDTARATLRRSFVRFNTAGVAPGGIYNSGGVVSLPDTVVSGNTPTNCSGSPSPVRGCAG